MVTPFWSITWKLGGFGNSEKLVERIEIGTQGGVDPFLDNRDRLAGTGSGDRGAVGAGKRDLVDSVGLAELVGGHLTAKKRQLAGDCVRSLSVGGIRQPQFVGSIHILVSDANRNGVVGDVGSARKAVRAELICATPGPPP